MMQRAFRLIRTYGTCFIEIQMLSRLRFTKLASSSPFNSPLLNNAKSIACFTFDSLQVVLLLWQQLKPASQGFLRWLYV